MKLEPQDKITEIRFNEQEDTAAIYTHNKYMRDRLEKLAHDHPAKCQIIEYTNGGRGVRCIVPRTWIRINPGMNLSAEQRQAKADRFRQYSRNRRKTKTD